VSVGRIYPCPPTAAVSSDYDAIPAIATRLYGHCLDLDRGSLESQPMIDVVKCGAPSRWIVDVDLVHVDNSGAAHPVSVTLCQPER